MSNKQSLNADVVGKIARYMDDFQICAMADVSSQWRMSAYRELNRRFRGMQWEVTIINLTWTIKSLPIGERPNFEVMSDIDVSDRCISDWPRLNVRRLKYLFRHISNITTEIKLVHINFSGDTFCTFDRVHYIMRQYWPKARYYDTITVRLEDDNDKHVQFLSTY